MLTTSSFTFHFCQRNTPHPHSRHSFPSTTALGIPLLFSVVFSLLLFVPRDCLIVCLFFCSYADDDFVAGVCPSHFRRCLFPGWFVRILFMYSLPCIYIKNAVSVNCLTGTCFLCVTFVWLYLSNDLLFILFRCFYQSYLGCSSCLCLDGCGGRVGGVLCWGDPEGFVMKICPGGRRGSGCWTLKPASWK